jgi:hypothetical protein
MKILSSITDSANSTTYFLTDPDDRQHACRHTNLDSLLWDCFVHPEIYKPKVSPEIWTLAESNFERFNQKRLDQRREWRERQARERERARKEDEALTEEEWVRLRQSDAYKDLMAMREHTARMGLREPDRD